MFILGSFKLENIDGLLFCDDLIVDDTNQPGITLGDNLGQPFYYEKTQFVSLRYLKIKRVERKEQASLLWVEGSNSPFTVPRPPEDGYSWAGILHMRGYPWVLYEYSQTKLKDTRKKI